MITHFRSYFLVACLAGIAVVTFFLFQPFLAPIILGAVFAVVLHPLYLRLVRAYRGRESLAALSTVVLSMVAILIPMILIGYQLFQEAQQLYTSITEGNMRAYLSSVANSLGMRADQFFPGASESLNQFVANADEYARLGLSWIIQHLGSAFTSIAAVVLSLFIFFVTLYYLLRDGAALKDYLIALSPLSDKDDETIVRRLELAVNSVVKGKLAISATQGILTGIGFWMFGVPNPVLWGLFAGIASLVPPLGTALVIAPAVLLLAATDHLIAAIGLALWGVLAVGLVDNFLGPILMSSGMKLHPLLVLLSVLGGLPLFGPVGIFLGPLTVSLLVALLHVYRYLIESPRVPDSMGV